MTRCPFDGVAHRRWIGDPFPRDVERRSVIDRYAQVRKAERHVDRLLERECLDWDERLVVIHGHDDIIFSTSDRAEERVGCVRSADRDPGGAGGFDPSTNLLLFVPKPPALPGVRIERGGRQAWR